MKRHNYHRWFINRYNSMPRFIRSCIDFVMQRVCGNSWHESFILKGVNNDIEYLRYELDRVHNTLKDRQKAMSKEYTEIVNNNFWDLI